MAQHVGYFEDNVEYTEGPFVMVLALDQWRIEVELKGHHCPVLPDLSIYRIEDWLGLHGKTSNTDLATRVCDKLNKMVHEGKIVLNEHGQWVAKSVS